MAETEAANKATFFTHDPKFYSNLLMIAVPLILQNLITTGVGMANSIMVGHLGESAIAGVSQANQIQTMLHMMMLGVSAASIMIASQYWGRGDTQSVRDIVYIAFKFSFTVSLILMIVVFCFTENAMMLFSNKPDVIKEGAAYLRIVSLSYVFFGTTTCFLASMRCVETVIIALVVSIVTLLIDVVLNYILIFGKFGAPVMGVRGAGIATVTARFVEMCTVLIYVRFFDKRLRIRFKELLSVNWNLCKDFFRHGSPVIAGDLMWGVGLSVHSMIMGHMDDTAAPAASMALTLFGVVQILTTSTGAASAVIIGKTVGAKDYGLVKQYARSLQVIFVGLAVVVCSVVLASRGLFISLYNISDATSALAGQFILILALSSLFSGYHIPCFGGIIRAGGDKTFLLKVDQCFVWILVIPLSAFAAFVLDLPPLYVFLCLKCDQFIKWIIAYFKVNSYTWIKDLTRQAK